MKVAAIAVAIVGCLLLTLGTVLLARGSGRVRVPARALGYDWNVLQGRRYDVDFFAPDGRYIRTMTHYTTVRGFHWGFPGYVWVDPTDPLDAWEFDLPPSRLAGMILLGFGIAALIAAGILGSLSWFEGLPWPQATPSGTVAS